MTLVNKKNTVIPFKKQRLTTEELENTIKDKIEKSKESIAKLKKHIESNTCPKTLRYNARAGAELRTVPQNSHCFSGPKEISTRPSEQKLFKVANSMEAASFIRFTQIVCRLKAESE